jgi:hypothetical protein
MTAFLLHYLGDRENNHTAFKKWDNRNSTAPFTCHYRELVQLAAASRCRRDSTQDLLYLTKLFVCQLTNGSRRPPRFHTVRCN